MTKIFNLEYNLDTWVEIMKNVERRTLPKEGLAGIQHVKALMKKIQKREMTQND
jgi:hypothetical protein